MNLRIPYAVNPREQLIAPADARKGIEFPMSRLQVQSYLAPRAYPTTSFCTSTRYRMF